MSLEAPQPPSRRTLRWAALGFILLLGMMLFFRLGQDLPLRSHEALLAATARNMVHNTPVPLADGSQGSPWLIPTFNGVPRLNKTPLPYWLTAGLAHLTGRVDEWTARISSAVSGVATVLIFMGLLARRRR